MSIIGEAVLTASVELLLTKLVSSELLRFPGRKKIQAQLKQWERKLNAINAVLADAEEKQITNPAVKAWLVELQILAYDVEDILDEFSTKLSLESEATTSKAKRLLVNLKPPSVKFNAKMRSKIKEITKRLQEITDEKNELKLIANSEERPNKVREGRIPTTSLKEAHVYGREKDQEAIIELLLKNESNEDGLSVIPIVGMGGVGKTTLAQNVYNDVRVESHFDIRAWSCVSDDFDIIRVTQAILKTRNSSDLNELQVELKGKLLGKKFLIVLDDIWSENPNKLESLLRPFKSNSPGGKIIVTTRSDNISSMVGTRPAYPLRGLSDDDCLSIFAHHSLGREGFNGHPEYLKKIGENIVKRCKGLPLAAKTLGGLLRNNTSSSYWEHVLNSKIWNLPTEEGDIMPALRLSYHYLPPHLKPCFAYCSLLPKDYEFKEEEIILLWMAQGFLQQKDSTEEQLEDLGDSYFRELQSRSFFQQSSTGSSDTSTYVMHDLINDLAQWVAGEFLLRMENVVEGDNNRERKISKNLRHLSYIGHGLCDGIKTFEAFYGVKSLSNLTYNGGLSNGLKMFEAFNDLRHLRTFLPFLPDSGSHLSWDILNVLPKLRRLRILSLKGYEITELSDAIGDLEHLRYLDLSDTAIEVLSNSVGRLYNLQTLKLEGCFNLKKWCEGMENLCNLRYLSFFFSSNLEGMPSNIGKLISLRTLSDFVVGKSTDRGLKELKTLKHLRGRLRISRLENVNDAMDAKEADLSSKKNLTVLVLEWTGWAPRNEKKEIEVLDMLQPCNEKLEKLTISGYGGTMFPTWLGNTSFSNLVYLQFVDCNSCTSLPSVGQLPSLKELYIRGMSAIKRVGQEFYGNCCATPFPKLEIITLRWMNEWAEWEDGELPQLRELTIIQCPKLQGRLPKHLPSLKKLHIRGCNQLLVSVLSLSSDCDIEIDGCKQVEHRNTIGLSSLNPLVFSDVASHMFLINQFRQRVSEVEDVSIVGYEEATSSRHTGITSQRDVKDDFACLAKLPQALHSFSYLRSMCIAKCPGLVSFSEAGLPSQLKSIRIEFCAALKSLPESWMDNTSLECLSIYKCGSLTFLARNKLPPNLKQLEIRFCDYLQTLMQEENNTSPSSISSSFITSELPATIEYIAIEQCSNLRSLSSSGNLPKALETIEILYCSSLVSFPVGELPSMNLVTIRIKGCEKLVAFTDNMLQLNPLQVTGSDCSRLCFFPEGRLSSANLTQLMIEIRDCSSLVAFPYGGLPFTNLTELTIENCGKLEVLPNRLQQLNHLQKIEISNCSSFVSFPDGGLPSTSLTELIIKNCEKLESLPNSMHNLTSLRELVIKNCPGIKSFPPEDGFAPNLTLLAIRKLKIFKPLSQWGLHRLTSLELLHIEGCPDVVSFPMEELLPSSLIALEITDFPSLKCLSSPIQNLSSLKGLQFSKCPKLKSFPKKGLPLSLLALSIHQCPLLEQKCKKSRGKYWPLIAHIPRIEINNSEED
ncbi:hypothetical protein JRO89_XS02G0281300 [Xanthoceras sorbifolium]|uniref:Disease resistance RPP13-like protein 1 n=1 Tax=Xanthoceras sorbifolium TaxID=99658 RepID=A0ABQ8IIP3_9ROSI|nr:hypothetical protein JRO89_XS02G0281300 [Xanthoceras sorbifolium]